MPETRVSRVPDPIGVEGTDGSTQASDANPFPTSTIVAGAPIDPRAIRALLSGTDSITIVPSGTQNVDVTANTVGLATSAKQDTQQTTLDSLLKSTEFQARINTLGQKTSAQSTPVVLPSDQTVPVSGPLTDAQLRAADVTVTLDSEQVDVSDRAARDLGKVDVAALDQYTPADVDSGAGTENAVPVSWRKTASGGSAEFGTASDPVRTDPTGSTTQPVSAASLPLPSGAATLAEQQDANPFAATANAPSSDTATTTAASILSANTSRRQFTIRNRSTITTLLLAYTSPASATDCSISIGPGQVWVEDRWRGEVWAMTSTGTAPWTLQEVEE